MAIKLSRRQNLKYKICVSGAADSGHCSLDAVEKAEELGREIARRDMVLVTGATVGIPYWAAKGAKEEGGIVIGVSPAASEAAHTRSYRLPTDYHDLIMYTGFEYSGRNLLLVRSSDATVTVCGRMGTLNEFTIAFEDQKPIGVLEGTGGTADEIRELVGKMHRGPGRIVYSKDVSDLLDKLVEEIEKDKKANGVKRG
ncbi:LOG family protein [Patescibacteria group bacterium]|nr:LOG family protein [Patescibacteria group bacterium]